MWELACLFITHDVATVRAIADEVVVMQRGRVVDQARRSAMFTPPYQDYTGLLFSSEPEMDPGWLDHFSDLYAMQWNPVASAADFSTRENPDYLVYALEQRLGVKKQSIAAAGFSAGVCAETARAGK